MLKREITYEDFNGNTVTETLYFNISKPELLELEVEQAGGLMAYLQNIINAEDHNKVLKEFKKIVLLAYGQKSADGKRFIKSDELREEFSQTAAYQTLFMELATNDEAGAAFIRGVLPKDLVTQPDQDKPQTPEVPAQTT